MLMIAVSCSKSSDERQTANAGKNEVPASLTPTTPASAGRACSLPPERLPEPTIEVEIRRTRWQIRDVYVGDRNITQFDRPQAFYDMAVSPSDKYLLVWHSEYPPRELSVYEIATGRRLCNFVPGFGGTMRWAAYDLIYHEWGAGTNLAQCCIYTVDGKLLWCSVGSGLDLCESGKYVFFLPSMPSDAFGIMITDIRNGDVIGHERPSDLELALHTAWIDGQTLRVWYGAANRTTMAVDVRIDPDHPIPFETFEKKAVER